MKAFKYTLDRSSKKFLCPACAKKTFVKFIDIDKNYAPEKFGRCDREDRCGYFTKPDDAEEYVFIPRPIYEEKPTSFIPKEHAISTFKDYHLNSLIQFLIKKFGEKKVNDVINQYRIGIDDTSSFTKDWVIFWQFDINNNIRSGKMIKYGKDGKRSKEHPSTWYHKKKHIPKDFNLKQCLFGEHLLNTINKPVALVESEKTAIIASLFIDKYLWLACGGKNELRALKLQVLKNRSVTLFPDLGAFNLWSEKAKEFDFNVSNHIEKIATSEDRENGLDIADFLLR